MKNQFLGGNNHCFEITTDDAMLIAILEGNIHVYVNGIDMASNAYKNMSRSPKLFNKIVTYSLLSLFSALC